MEKEGKLPHISALKTLLASEYVVYVKTQNFHWNVTGMWFHALHVLFKSQYETFQKNIDLIAEEIRKYGKHAPGTMEKFLKLKLNNVSEAEKHLSQEGMIQSLALDHHALINYINKITTAVEWYPATQNLLADIQNFHMTAYWMLVAHLHK